MLKRKVLIQVLVVFIILLTTGTNILMAQAALVDIERFEIIFQKGFDNGVPESPLP